MTEQRCSDEVIVQCWHRLARVDIAKFHEWGLVLRFKHERSTEIKLGNGQNNAIMIEALTTLGI
jgi:hypothetical protein